MPNKKDESAIVKILPEFEVRQFFSELKKRGKLEKNEGISIATLSFPIVTKSNKKDKKDKSHPKYNNSPIIQKIIQEREPDILLCAGYTISNKVLPAILKTTKTTKTTIVLEVYDDYKDNRMKNLIIQGGEPINPPSTICFVNNCQAQAKCCVNDLDNQISQRNFKISDKNVFLLICGEVTAVHCVRGEQTRFRNSITKELKNAIDKSSIRLNPNHTYMKPCSLRQGKFLSMYGKIYVRVANWKHGTKFRSSTIHKLWMDGLEQRANIAHCPIDVACYHEWLVH